MEGIGFVLAAFVALTIWGWQIPRYPDIRLFWIAPSVTVLRGSFETDMVEFEATHKLLVN